MIVYLVRHGETAYNRDGLALGTADVPLTELGELQAAAAAQHLAGEPIDRIYTSPLVRAANTARAIAGERGIPVEARAELLELDVGVTEGMPFAVLREQHGQFLKEWAGPSGHLAVMPGGESVVDVERRLGGLVEELWEVRHKAVAVVTHNFVLRVLFCRLMGLDVAAFRSMAFDVASISVLSLERGRAGVVRLNDCCHLESLNLDRERRSV